MKSPEDLRIARLECVAENDIPARKKRSDEALRELKAINPTYHRCYDWDGMVICNTNPEWECCLCNLGEHSRLKH